MHGLKYGSVGNNSSKLQPKAQLYRRIFRPVTCLSMLFYDEGLLHISLVPLRSPLGSLSTLQFVTRSGTKLSLYVHYHSRFF
jgi:hypothetical protein